MKKSLIIPIIGLIILGVSAFLFFNKNEERDNKNVTLPSSLFDTVDFYDMKPLNQKELGDFYIVNFFASWCKPCLAEHPLLMELQSKGIKIIGINFRDDEENFVTRHHRPPRSPGCHATQWPAASRRDAGDSAASFVSSPWPLPPGPPDR